MTLLRLVNNCQQRLLCGLFVLICMSNFVTAQDLSPTESLRLENYLNRMNLDRLVAAHLRQRLATTEDADERKMLAEKLANVYATQLLDPKANQEPSETKADANRLFAIYPDLDSPLLRVAIMHARYQQANLDFHQWWYAAQPTGSRQNITDLLRDLIQDLLQLKQRMENRRNELTVSEQFGNPTHSQGLETIENVLIHTQYLIGWSTYFRSVVERGNQAEWLAISEDHFRDFLQIERTKLIVEVAESWFDFDSGWTARGLIGLALCKEAQNQLAASRKCFELLTNANRKSLNEVMPLWKLKSALFAERVTTALQLAQQFKASTTLSADSRVRYWTTACRGGMALLSSGSNDARRLVQLAMAGLTREMQADIIQELVTEYNIRLPSDNFLGNWIQGYLLFVKSEKSNDRDAMAQVHEKLEAALNDRNPKVDEADRARCLFLLAWVHFRQRMFEVSEQEFKQVVEQLRSVDRSIAAQAHWYRIQSLVEISRRSPRTTNAAFAAMEQMVRWFPDAPMTERVEFEKMKLNLRALPDDEAVHRLLAIPPDDVSFVDARYELVQKQYRVLIRMLDDDRPAQAQFDKLIEWELQNRNDPRLTPERRLRAILLVVDAHRRRSTASGEWLEWAEIIKQTAEVAENLPDKSSPLYVEFRYQEFLFAKNQESAEAEVIANWLFKNAKGTRYETPALIYLAQQYKLRFDEAQPATEELDAALDIYRRLVEVSGDSNEKLQNSVNSRVAVAQLAILYAKAQNYTAADKLNQRLIEVFPGNRDYLLAAARVKMKLGESDNARSLWRRLAGGVDAGTETWHEAKHQLAVCIGRDDPDSALQLVRQTRQLSPQMPAEWSRRFDSLETTLERQK